MIVYYCLALHGSSSKKGAPVFGVEPKYPGTPDDPQLEPVPGLDDPDRYVEEDPCSMRLGSAENLSLADLLPCQVRLTTGIGTCNGRRSNLDQRANP